MTSIGQHLIIPEPYHAIIATSQPSVSDSIMRIIDMLSSIYLDDEAALAANEVDRIGSNWFLPNEFESVQTSGPQFPPQRCFGVGRSHTQMPGAAGPGLIGTSQVAIPPSPARLRCASPGDLSPACGERLVSHIAAT
jgi:hypothetical protein